MRRRTCPVPGTRRPPWTARLTAAALRPIWRALSDQAAAPHGPIGRLLAWNWLRETAAVNDTALDLLAPAAGERVLEIGFGPGRTLDRLAAAGAHVIGVDASPTMVAAATRRNATHITAGRLDLHHGDATTLPAPASSLDAVLSVHSVYFWPDPPAILAAIGQVLRPGGRLVLAFRTGDQPMPTRFDPDVYRVPTTLEVEQWLIDAGFTEVRCEVRPDLAPAVVWLVATTGAS